MTTADGEGADGEGAAPTEVSSIKQRVFLAGGFMGLTLAAVGLVLPIVPTAPFLLVSVACFSRSSRRFERRILEHPRFGPPIERFREHDVISRGAKLAATASFLVSIAAATLFSGPVAGAIVGGILLCVAVWVWTRPSEVSATA